MIKIITETNSENHFVAQEYNTTGNVIGEVCYTIFRDNTVYIHSAYVNYNNRHNGVLTRLNNAILNKLCHVPEKKDGFTLITKTKNRYVIKMLTKLGFMRFINDMEYFIKKTGDNT